VRKKVEKKINQSIYKIIAMFQLINKKPFVVLKLQNFFTIKNYLFIIFLCQITKLCNYKIAPFVLNFNQTCGVH
jgi:hypothetical protein